MGVSLLKKFRAESFKRGSSLRPTAMVNTGLTQSHLQNKLNSQNSQPFTTVRDPKGLTIFFSDKLNMLCLSKDV